MAELQQHPSAHPSEWDSLRACTYDPSIRILPPPPDGSGAAGDLGRTFEEASSTVDCPAPDPGPVSSTAWIVENDRLFDADDLGHVPDPWMEDQAIGSSDPRVVTLADGSQRLYFAAFHDGIMTATSDDGVSWTLGPQVISDGGPHVTLVDLPEGGWRLFAVKDVGGRASVVSYTTPDGVAFTAEPGTLLTNEDFPYGAIQSPFVLPMADGTYRMYLTAVPPGESVGQPGGNSAYWMVGATSPDMLTWTVDPTVAVAEMLHPWAGLEADGSVTVYGGKMLVRIRSTDGATFGPADQFDVWGADYHVTGLDDGQVRIYTGSHDFDEGSWIRILRSSTIPWDVELLEVGWDRDGLYRVKACVTGSSSTPIELHLADPDFRIRDHDLEGRVIDVASGTPPFSATLSFTGGGLAGQQDIEQLLQITDGTAVREWRVLELMGLFENGYYQTSN